MINFDAGGVWLPDLPYFTGDPVFQHSSPVSCDFRVIEMLVCTVGC